MYTPLDEFAKEHGFEDARALSRLTAKVNISNPDTWLLFSKWKDEDGSKDGLLKLIPSEDVK